MENVKVSIIEVEYNKEFGYDEVAEVVSGITGNLRDVKFSNQKLIGNADSDLYKEISHQLIIKRRPVFTTELVDKANSLGDGLVLRITHRINRRTKGWTAISANNPQFIISHISEADMYGNSLILQLKPQGERADEPVEEEE